MRVRYKSSERPPEKLNDWFLMCMAAVDVGGHCEIGVAAVDHRGQIHFALGGHRLWVVG